MPIAVALWSVVINPGQPVSVIPQGDLVITNAALGTELADSTGRTSVKLTYTRPIKVTSDDEDEEDEDNDQDAQVESVLCSFTPGKIEQCTLNLTFEEDDEFLLEVVGNNEVHLSGNYIDQAPDQVPYNDESEPESDYALDEVSSDVELNPEEAVDLPSDDEEEDEGRFEEVKSEHEAETTKSAKRRRESDAVEHDETTGDTLSKKKAKKLKAENGAAAPAPAGTGDEASKKSKKDKKAKKGEAKEGEPKKGENKEGESKTKQGDKANVRELANGLKIQDAKLGDGPQAKKGAKVFVRYIGKLPDGKVFDSNTKGKPFTFRLGAGEVIKGWDEGVAGMKVGGERLLIVPPSLGYGNRKMDAIPPNSTLRFEVKLIDMK
ncbi:hypothetical protein B0F90DRAFT_1700692 [Multifurca ochricompacta]|uniref:FK506-binding protein n=1 Tax=Multifurca ochricompacta TaxID=376703 RepID=A0AAD4QR47_9AGAM|nr:hypothetical protein B0F90DRAFT_1700692 [Multifurca ochricompacta]